MAKRGVSNKAKRRLTREFMLNNPTASNADVSRAVKVSQSLASQVRGELRVEGLVRPSPMDRTSRPSQAILDAPTTPQEQTTEDVEIIGTRRLMELAAAEEAKTPGGLDFTAQEAMLIRFAKKEDESLATRMTAMDRLNKLRGDQGGRDALGPGAPLTQEDMIVRLTFLIKAAGFKIAVTAFERAFKKGGAASGEAQAVGPATIEPSPEAIEPTGHNDQDAEAPREEGHVDLERRPDDEEAGEHPGDNRPPA
jgi:hypothetical protein